MSMFTQKFGMNVILKSYFYHQKIVLLELMQLVKRIELNQLNKNSKYIPFRFLVAIISKPLFFPVESKFNGIGSKTRSEIREKIEDITRRLSGKLDLCSNNGLYSCYFQARGQALVKALTDVYDQIDQTQVEATTFDLLRQNELLAIPKRLEVIEQIFI